LRSTYILYSSGLANTQNRHILPALGGCMKKIVSRHKNVSSHWVGDGFPVRTMFDYNGLAKEISPFLLLDYAGPMVFPPTSEKKGVGEHPHRGFETVSIVYSGQVEHRDSAGGGGMIQAGDVQWMTAASGLVHEEFHGKDFAKSGGLFEVVQLWVNLPQKYKMHTPRYQSIKSESIPEVSLERDGHKGVLRVIAGNYQGHIGPAKTFSPINLFDIRLQKGQKEVFFVEPGYTASVFILSGKVDFGDKKIVGPVELVLLEREGNTFEMTAHEDAKILFMGGQPLNEPIIGRGPFVMNTKEELQQAFIDFQEGKMGTFEKIEGSD